MVAKHISKKIASLAAVVALTVSFGAVAAASLPAPLALQAEQCGTTGGPQDEGGVEVAIEVGCGDDANPIYAYAKGLITFLAAVVGIVVVGALVVGGIGYASARDDKSQVARSIEIIRNAIVGLLLFIGMTAILNFVIPGGLFS